MARKKQYKDYIERPAGKEDGTYIVDCTCLAMTVMLLNKKAGASLETTGVKPGIVSEVASTELAEGVIITANNGGQKEVEDKEMTH